MSVKLVDKEAGERLYQYIAGRLDALPQELRDKERLLKALVYVQRTYGLTPQQVMEKLRERKGIATSRGIPEIRGKALERLAGVLKTFYNKYDVRHPELMLTGSGLSVIGLSSDRRVGVSTVLGFRAGEGYTAPPSVLTAVIDMDYFPEENVPEKIIIRDDGVYAVTNSGDSRKIGNIVESERAPIIDSLERNMESKESRLDIEAKPEVLQAIRKLLASEEEADLVFVKEGGKPAMYIGIFNKPPNNRYVVRVPDSLITKAYVDPNAPDGALTRFSYIITKKGLPETSENVLFTTKVFPRDSNKAFPLRIVTKGDDGVLYHVYYAPDLEEVVFRPPEEPLVTYPISDDAVPNSIADMVPNVSDIYMLPEKDKIYFAGTDYKRENITNLVEINVPPKTVDQATLDNVFTIIDFDGAPGFLPTAYKIAKTLGLQPSIDISVDELSLFGTITSIGKAKDETAKTIREKIEKFKELPEKYTYITLTGKDLVDILEKFNEHKRSEDYYFGHDRLRINVKPGGVAELEAYRMYDNDKKVLWRKETKVSNPHSEPFDLNLYIENLADTGRLPLVELSPRGFYNIKGLASILKNATIDIFFQPDGKPLATRTRLGNVTIYRSLE